MSDSYFSPMYGGLMLPFAQRQGSANFASSSGFYGVSSNPDEHISPFADANASPFADISPLSGMGASYLDSRSASPMASAVVHDVSYDFKRMRSTSEDSVSISTDVSPVSSEYQLPKSKRPRAAASMVPVMEGGILPDYDQPMHILKLGDEGRAKLKSALSERVRCDAEVKRRVDAVGKIRLASMHQLMRMARVSGLWQYAETLAREHEVTKLRKTS